MDCTFMMADKIFYLTALVSLASCHERKDVSPNQALDIARSYVIKTPPFSRTPLDIANPKLRQDGENYVVSFSLKTGYTGGAPVIYVRKHDGKVIRYTGTQ